MRWSRPKAPHVKVGRAYSSILLKGGPLDGIKVLERNLIGGKSLLITLHGMTGRYHNGNWKEVQLG